MRGLDRERRREVSREQPRERRLSVGRNDRGDEGKRASQQNRTEPHHGENRVDVAVRRTSFTLPSCHPAAVVRSLE